MKLRYYSIPLAAILLCVAYAIVVSVSYVDHSDLLPDYSISMSNTFGPEQKPGMESPQVPTARQLIDQSQVIVKARFEGDRKITGNGFYSNVTVLEVYKGEDSLQGTTLRIVEEMSVFQSTRYLNTSGKIYLPLQAGNDYLLLLNKVTFDPARKLNEFQQNQYYPTTQTVLATYRFCNDQQSEAFPNGSQPTLAELKGCDVPTWHKEDLSIYYQTKDMLFSLLDLSIPS